MPGLRSLPSADLHKTWDHLLKVKLPPKKVVSRTQAILDEPELVTAGDAARLNLDISKWLAESNEAATKTVYHKDIRDAVKTAEAHPDDDLDPIDLPASYFTAAEALAKKRATEAGFRLAKIVEDLGL